MRCSCCLLLRAETLWGKVAKWDLFSHLSFSRLRGLRLERSKLSSLTEKSQFQVRVVKGLGLRKVEGGEKNLEN